MQSTAGHDLRYEYNQRGQLAKVYQNGELLSELDYDVAGRLASRTHGPSATSTYTYDFRHQPTDVVTETADGDYTQTYTYSDDGFIEWHALQWELEEPWFHQYRYDGLGRLTNNIDLVEDHGERFDYDDNGNLTAYYPTYPTGTPYYTSSYNSRDQLTSRVRTLPNGSQTYTYDHNGNLTGLTGFDGNLTLTWNPRGRLTGVTSSETGAAVSYQYDYRDDKIARTDNGQTVWYLIDDQNPTGYAQVIAELDDLDRPTRRYFYGDRLLADEHVDVDGVSEGRLHYVSDHLHSTRLLVDDSGTPVERYDYPAYGYTDERPGTRQQAWNASTASWTDASFCTTATPYLYTGEFTDCTTALQYNRARWYAAGVGRFVSVDPFTGSTHTPLSTNAYLYGDGSPLVNRDPTGNFSLTETSITSVVQAVLNVIVIPNVMSYLVSTTLRLAGVDPNALLLPLVEWILSQTDIMEVLEDLIALIDQDTIEALLRIGEIIAYVMALVDVAMAAAETMISIFRALLTRGATAVVRAGYQTYCFVFHYFQFASTQYNVSVNPARGGKFSFKGKFGKVPGRYYSFGGRRGGKEHVRRILEVLDKKLSEGWTLESGGTEAERRYFMIGNHSCPKQVLPRA